MELHLDATEIDLLIRLLDHELRETRVEVRRTETPSFRMEVEAEESQIRSLLEKLRALAGGG